MSIMPSGSESNTDSSPNSLKGVAQLMLDSPDPFTNEVGHLIDYIGHMHEPPVVCEDCRDDNRDRRHPCLMQDCAISITIAWLRKVIGERG